MEALTVTVSPGDTATLTFQQPTPFLVSAGSLGSLAVLRRELRRVRRDYPPKLRPRDSSLAWTVRLVRIRPSKRDNASDSRHR